MLRPHVLPCTIGLSLLLFPGGTWAAETHLASGCSRLLGSAFAQNVHWRAEISIAQAWLDILRESSEPGGLSTWLRQAMTGLEEFGGSSLREMLATQPPRATAEIRQALEELSNLVLSLTSGGSIDEAAFRKEWIAVIRRELEGESASVRIEKAASEARVETTGMIRGIQTDSGLPKLLPNGNILLIRNDGVLTFINPKLEIVHQTQAVGRALTAPFVFSNGRIIEFTEFDGARLYEQDGTLVRSLEIPGPTRELPVLAVSADRALLRLEWGEILLLDSEGNIFNPGPLALGIARPGDPLELPDGSFWLPVGTTLHHLLSDGTLLDSKAVVGATHPSIPKIARFSDGTLVAPRTAHRLAFCNEDGSAKRKDWQNSLEVDAGGPLVRSPFSVLSGRVAFATSNWRFAILNADGSVFWETNDFASIGGPPLELSDGSFLLMNTMKRFVITGPAHPVPVPTAAAEGWTLSQNATRLPNGMAVLLFDHGYFKPGLLQILRPDGTEYLRIELPEPVRATPLLDQGHLLYLSGARGSLTVLDLNEIDSQ